MAEIVFDSIGSLGPAVTSNDTRTGFPDNFGPGLIGDADAPDFNALELDFFESIGGHQDITSITPWHMNPDRLGDFIRSVVGSSPVSPLWRRMTNQRIIRGNT